jgi:anaerobic selenocysteine-containing dehydrogenase
MLSLDIYLNETTRHADVILPGRSALEDGHWDVPFAQFSYRNQARYSPPVLPAAADHPPEWQQLLRLAAIAQGLGSSADLQAMDDAVLRAEVRRALGTDEPAAVEALMADLSRRQGPERLLDLALRHGPHGAASAGGLSLDKLLATPGGIDLGPLAPRLPEALRTPSGRVELAPPMLLADLARVAAELALPAPGAQPAGGLWLIGRRDVRSNNSWMHNLPTLAKGPARCTLLVHPADAARLGLKDGGLARLSRDGRQLEAPVALSEAMMPGVASLPHGWGHDLPGARLGLAAQRPGVNLNTLTDDRAWDSLSGNAVLSGVEVVVGALQPTA